MRLIKTIRYFLCSLLLLGATTASAGILTHGGDTIGWTDNSGNDWLRLDVKDDLGNEFLKSTSYTSLSSGISFAGRNWRLASINDILGMWNDFAPYVHDTGRAITSRFLTPSPEGEALRDAFGITEATRFNSETWTRGYSSETAVDIAGNILSIASPSLYLDRRTRLNGDLIFNEVFWNTRGSSGESQPRSAWMISTGFVSVAVPEPATWILFCGGLFGFGVTRLRGTHTQK